MSRSSGIWVLAFVCLVLVLASSMMNVTDPAPVASNPTAAPWSVLGDSTFTFAYGGDMGANGSHAPTALARLRADLANLSFFLAVGDLSYSTQAGSEPSWCKFVNWSLKKPAQFPFELLSGNHESSGAVLIDNFVKCEPNHVPGIVGGYGKEYYFDYPKSSPIARFILISPALSFTYGGSYNYNSNTTHQRWLVHAIDSARGAGIKWIVVAMHKVCISVGVMTCEIGQGLMDLLIQKRVDLVIQGHDHDYQRTKQLSCAKAGVGRPECVADANSPFVKGAGTVFTICGTMGQSLSGVHMTTDSERVYFATAMGGNTSGYGYGFCRVTLTNTTLSMSTSFSGSYQDQFKIGS